VYNTVDFTSFGVFHIGGRPLGPTSSVKLNENDARPKEDRDSVLCKQRTIRLHSQTPLCTAKLGAGDVSQRETVQTGAELKR